MRSNHHQVGQLTRAARTMAAIIEYGEACGLSTADWVLACKAGVSISGLIHGSRNELDEWVDVVMDLAGEPDSTCRDDDAEPVGSVIRMVTWQDYEGITIQLSAVCPADQG